MIDVESAPSPVLALLGLGWTRRAPCGIVATTRDAWAPRMRTDEELMQAFTGGDATAFGELFQRWAAPLVRVAQRQLGARADAEDIVQQTFLQLHRARHDFKPGMKLRPWLFTIALNLCRDLQRYRGRRHETPVEDVVLVAETPAQSARETAELQARVRTALGQLSAEQRAVIELHWFEELPFGEIATIVGASAGAVRVRAHRGYEALRKALGAEVGLPAMEEA
jgi:RNA polymerase sigma-70 factor (ECF subfamily)